MILCGILILAILFIMGVGVVFWIALAVMLLALIIMVIKAKPTEEEIEKYKIKNIIKRKKTSN